jgi:hypothetical protein
MLPSVAAEPPPGWIATEIERPALGGGSGATLTQWSALRSPASGEVFLLGCVATPIPGWVEDMRPSVEARTAAMASSSAQRIVGAGVDDPSRLGATRKFLGWNDREVVTCFATCAAPHPMAPDARQACDASVAGARLEGGSAPPPAGLALGAVTWAVHHPSKIVVGGGLLTFFVGALAVVARRKPRSRV